MTMRISLITPSYNQGKFLQETISSVVEQSCPVDEYIVIDGGSSDGSRRIIENNSHKISYWVSESDRGQSDALIKGFSRATGDVLGWLNSDDILLPGAIRKVREAFDRDPSVDVVSGYHVWIDGDSKIISQHRPGRESELKARNGIVRVAQQTCFFKRDLYERVGGIDVNLHCVMDHELWYRMFDAGARWGHLASYLAGYRWHDTSKGNTWSAAYSRERAWLGERYPRYSPSGARAAIALWVYRAAHVATGRYLMSRRDTIVNKGKHIYSVFAKD